MQLANVLSDLSTLRACEPQDALNLFTLPTATSATATIATTTTTATKQTETGQDYLRAQRFLQLYTGLKARDGQGRRKLDELQAKIGAIVDVKVGEPRGEGDEEELRVAPGGF